jgi:hypothetical protein
MKVWGRLLCLLRPDLYCTIASPSVRSNLSKLIGVSQNHLVSQRGYIELLKLIHGAPWFSSPKPKAVKEQRVWERKAAMMDAIFYE